MAKRLGITGTIGSGKSTVGAMLQKRGITVVDTDVIVHDLLANSEHVRKLVLDRFGTVERTKLGNVVFFDPQAKKDLESILHPEAIAVCRKLVEDHQKESVVAFLVPLLFEANLEDEYDQIWSVQVDPLQLRNRLKKRNNFTDDEIDARLNNQLSQEVKSSKSHYTIDNSGSLEETEKQVDELLQRLLGH